jgi:hypothetical protein
MEIQSRRRNPFAEFKRTKQEIEREALTEAELERINSKVFSTDRLNYVKDLTYPFTRHTFTKQQKFGLPGGRGV